jgi:hypothetical protein
MTITQSAPQLDRVSELGDELREADQRTEQARLEFLQAQKDDPDSARDKRRAWDRARAARNELESLVLMQGGRQPTTGRS